MFGFVYVFFVLMMCLVFRRFLQLFLQLFTFLMFPLLVANWPLCINKFYFEI